MTAFWVAILVATCSTNIVDDPRVFRQVLRKPGDDNSKTYRIPGLATTPKGTLLTVFDIRYGSGADLPADIDVGLMRSTDEGATWSPMQRILDFDKAEPNSRGNGVGDPTILVDRQTGTAWVAALWSRGNRGWNGSGPGLTPDETGQFVLTKSTDDGVTGTVSTPTVACFFTSPATVARSANVATLSANRSQRLLMPRTSKPPATNARRIGHANCLGGKPIDCQFEGGKRRDCTRSNKSVRAKESGMERSSVSNTAWNSHDGDAPIV